MSRLMRAMPLGVAMVTPLLCAAAILKQGPWLLLPPLYLFVITPVLDELLGDRVQEIEDERAASTWRLLPYDLWLYAWVPIQLVLQGVALWTAADAAARADGASFAGLVFASGLLGGLGINVGHELMHRKGAPERALAELLLASVTYTHFCVEHVLGHHRTVSTPDDPATARRGESLPRFWVRSIVGGVRSAWRLESARVQKRGGRGTLRDRRLRYPLALACAYFLIAGSLGIVGVVAFALQSLIAILLLETINYLEHYGLARAQLDDGQYERVAPAHSWSSARRLTSLYLFNLTRHADHHAHASRPYYALRHREDAPTLPHGYASMLLLALIPPLWRRVVDPLLPARSHAPDQPAAR